MITNNCNEIFKQFEELRASYPGLSIRECEHHIEISGMLDFSATYNEIVIEGIFDILIQVPFDYPKTLPVVWEVGGRVSEFFHHFVDHSLCLGSELSMRIKLSDTPTLITYVQDLVIPYLYSYRHYELYGLLPYGELSHGAQGILEAYSEQFGTDSPEVTIRLLEALIKPYRGHHLCPCGRGLKVRSCHGEVIKRLISSIPQEIFIEDINQCRYFLTTQGTNASNKAQKISLTR